MLYYNVPPEDLFNWGYASAGDVVVPNYRSWDGKPVKKVYVIVILRLMLMRVDSLMPSLQTIPSIQSVGFTRTLLPY